MFKIGKLQFLLVLLLIINYSNGLRTVVNHLSSADLDRLDKVFLDGFKSNDLQSIYYSSFNLKQITPADKLATCKRLLASYSDSKLNDFEKNFYLLGTHKQLACSEKIPPTISDAKTLLTKDASTAQEIYYNYLSAKASSETIDEATKAKIVKNLQTILKKDDSLNSLGHAFFIAAELGSTHGSVIYDRIEDAIVQADEVDGKMLQFEGGLSITALIVNGALKLSSTLGKPSPLNAEQAVKFSAYFLSRSSVQTAKGASVLLEALKNISQQKAIAPICIQLAGNGQLLPESPVLSVKVCNLLGEPLQPALAQLSTTITSKQTKSALVSKVNLVPSRTDSTLFTYDLKSSNPSRGQYHVEIDAGAYKQSLNVNILGKVKVQLLEIGVGDSDSASSVKKQTVSYPSKLKEVLAADSQQKIVIKAVLVDESTTKPINVHQAFVLLRNEKTNDEIIFVAEQDTTKAYKFEMDVGARSADFGHKTGLYSINLIIGDALLSNSFKWHLSDVTLNFAQASTKDTVSTIRQPLPEIEHQFRAPEKRPPRFLSDLFTGLCLAPILLLFVFWAKLQANVSNFIFSLSSIGFHLGFGAILGLFGVFWLKLNMFETIRYLLPVLLVTFICGNKLLKAIAAKRTSEK
uniref:Dolichyl-diphosphooligosaccharide--protein glycosyltransferase subunit 2 n=1 Tax=Corethrella appendiculata TaxID=1370023 RepID=U5EVZ5_9DIPT